MCAFGHTLNAHYCVFELTTTTKPWFFDPQYTKATANMYKKERKEKQSKTCLRILLIARRTGNEEFVSVYIRVKMPIGNKNLFTCKAIESVFECESGRTRSHSLLFTISV